MIVGSGGRGAKRKGASTGRGSREDKRGKTVTRKNIDLKNEAPIQGGGRNSFIHSISFIRPCSHPIVPPKTHRDGHVNKLQPKPVGTLLELRLDLGADHRALREQLLEEKKMK
jgi:hypothetical protein